MLPYGNAKTSGSKVSCQHGPDECATNMAEACAIKHLPAAKDYMEFIFCAEAAARSAKAGAIIARCAPSGAAAAAIAACYGDGAGAEGTALIAEAGKETAPWNHQYTPWLVIDGKHSTAGEQSLATAICAAYTGPRPPAACKRYAEAPLAAGGRCFVEEEDLVLA